MKSLLMRLEIICCACGLINKPAMYAARIGAGERQEEGMLLKDPCQCGGREFWIKDGGEQCAG